MTECAAYNQCYLTMRFKTCDKKQICKNARYVKRGSLWKKTLNKAKNEQKTLPECSEKPSM